MGGIGFLLAVNVALSLGFAAQFAAIAWFDPSRKGPRWLALGFGLGIVYVLAEAVIASGAAPLVGHMVAGVGYTLALAAVCIGLGEHYGHRADRRLVGAIVLVSIPLYLGLFFLARDAVARQIGYQLPYIALQAVAAWLVAFAPRRHGALDIALIVALAANGLNAALRPLLAILVGGVGARAQDYAQSLYGLISQSSGAILVLIVAVLSFLVLARDMARHLMAKAEQDEDTGYRTPKAFDKRIALALEGRAGPQALIVVEVVPVRPDGAVPPETLSAVLAALESATPPWSERARLSAGVFAVFDPAANVLAARRAMRSFLAAASRPELRLCVGIAETEAEDVPALVLERGETALAHARRAGGDSVRIAPRSTLSFPYLRAG